MVISCWCCMCITLFCVVCCVILPGNAGHSEIACIPTEDIQDQTEGTQEHTDITQILPQTSDSESTHPKTYWLESSGDNTDRTREIQELLKMGCCELGPGDFYISGLEMPEGSCLGGSGLSTRLILADEENVYAIRLSSYCTVRDLQLLGALDVPKLSAEIGNRHGILFEGKATEKADRPELCQIENCLIQNFTGGGITCSDTGYAIRASINVTDCTILGCGAGINISYFSEYHQFSGVSVQKCYYGCVNNGGNNMFTNCGFSGNTVGFLIDNSQSQSPNNSHGSAVGCSFNHSGNNDGIGIRVEGAQYGFIFSGCQLFYAATDIKNSKGIVFDSCNFGKNESIYVDKKSMVMFNGCLFGSVPSIKDKYTGSVMFIDCFTRDGVSVNN